jgi:hypothetical protein
MYGLAEEGKTVIFASSSLPEVMGVADRIVVNVRRAIVGEVDRKDVSEETLLSMPYPKDNRGYSLYEQIVEQQADSAQPMGFEEGEDQPVSAEHLGELRMVVVYLSCSSHARVRALLLTLRNMIGCPVHHDDRHDRLHHDVHPRFRDLDLSVGSIVRFPASSPPRSSTRPATSISAPWRE